jgi:hypothetical protein
MLDETHRRQTHLALSSAINAANISLVGPSGRLRALRPAGSNSTHTGTNGTWNEKHVTFRDFDYLIIALLY